MGSIVHIISNPNYWITYPTDKITKPEYGGERLHKITYGEFDDDPCGTLPMEMFMRESILLKVNAGIYRVSKSSKYKQTLILEDCNGNIINPLASIIY